MDLVLRRRILTARSTIGALEVDGQFECLTLEDQVRRDPNPATPANEAKIPGQTAIPAGKYRVIVNHSARFQRLLPLLLDVPGFAGVRIHPGNTAEHTEGCILVGDEEGRDFIGNSRLAFNRLYPKIMAAFAKREPILLEILDPPAA
jgi:hypothetical protein